MLLNSKLVLPVALGLSLVSVTAFVVYYVFKKDEEGDENTVKTSKMNIIEVRVSKSIVPALIGRNGSNIKDIEQKSGAMIHFKKFTDKDYDVCIIRGRSTTTQLAETMIHDFIKQQPNIVEKKITVPSWACGRIIGSGGENVSNISHRSGARIKVEGQPADKMLERVITIRGTEDQIAVAKELIDNCVSQEKCRREIEQSKKSPRPTRASADRARSSTPTEPGDTPHAKYKRPESTTPSIEVYVSAVSSPSRFWVQFVGPQVSQLDELVQQMTEYYGKKENRESHALSHVSVGQVVAAVFRHDGRWYRARVQDIRPNEFDPTQQVADVFFLDYGDSEYVAVHELCELRADLLRLRFQAMECFLAGVRPAGTLDVSQNGETTQRWDKWPTAAVERFEELTQVARWRSLLSRTCTYKKLPTGEEDTEKEIPGIKLYDVTDEGELDIGEVLINEGYAVAGAALEHSHHTAPGTPFGDLGNSRVLGMLDGTRCSSVPKDHKDDRSEHIHRNDTEFNKDPEMTTSRSLASGLENSDKVMSVSNFDLNKPQQNGSHQDFLDIERSNLDKEGSSETLTPASPLSKTQREEIKANMNRIDSHHSNLEALGRTHDAHK